MIITNQKFDRISIEKEFSSFEGAWETGAPVRRVEFDREIERYIEKPQQIARVLPNEKIGLDCVQAFVTNMSTATTLEELDNTEGITLPEELMSAPTNEWTSPKWAKAGDIVFFMHSKTARSTITRLRTELNQDKDSFSKAEYFKFMYYLEHALDIHSQYGGKIFAVGRVCGAPEYVAPEEVINSVYHWKTRTYSAIDNIKILDKPVDISEFNSYILISRAGAITPLFDYEFDRLRNDISKENKLPAYIKNATARPVPLRSINDRNWIEIANDYRRCFILEKQFRQFYVDYLIREIGDQKKFFTECRCQRANISDSFMDYVMRFDGKLLPIETKLAVSAEPNIVAQVSKYVFNSSVFLDKEENRCVTGADFHDGKVLIIDTEKLYMYDDSTQTVSEIFDLDQLTSKADLNDVKRVIKENL